MLSCKRGLRWIFGVLTCSALHAGPVPSSAVITWNSANSTIQCRFEGTTITARTTEEFSLAARKHKLLSPVGETPQSLDDLWREFRRDGWVLVTGTHGDRSGVGTAQVRRKRIPDTLALPVGLDRILPDDTATALPAHAHSYEHLLP